MRVFRCRCIKKGLFWGFVTFLFWRKPKRYKAFRGFQLPLGFRPPINVKFPTPSALNLTFRQKGGI
jgi:hypothetical protein